MLLLLHRLAIKTIRRAMVIISAIAMIGQLIWRRALGAKASPAFLRRCLGGKLGLISYFFSGSVDFTLLL